MKTNIKTLVVLLTVFSATTMFANPRTEAAASIKVVAEKTSKIYRLVYNSPAKEDVTIEIYNDSKELVHTEKVSGTDGFIKRYNLSYLSSGAYEVVVKTAESKMVEAIDLEGINKYDFKVKSTGKNISLQGGHPDGKDFSVHIFGKDNELIYSESILNGKQIFKTYNLEKVPANEVSFKIYSEEKLISEEVFDL